jgi:hypothetical protein
VDIICAYILSYIDSSRFLKQKNEMDIEFPVIDPFPGTVSCRLEQWTKWTFPAPGAAGFR